MDDPTLLSARIGRAANRLRAMVADRDPLTLAELRTFAEVVADWSERVAVLEKRCVTAQVVRLPTKLKVVEQ